MNLTMRLTLDGLVRALRTRAEVIADERVEEARREPKPTDRTEDGDERRA